MKSGFAPTFSWRKIAVFALLAGLAMSAYRIGPFPYAESRFAQGGFGDYWELTLKPFLTAAFQPTLFDQNPNLPPDATPFWLRLIGQLGATLRYALVAMSIAVPAGLLLGFLASTAWWPKGAGGKWVKLIMLPINILIRMGMTFMRSIHELIWAIIFLIALGDEPLSACVALALPFAGTLGKVFSEIIDEQLPQARDQLVASGAGSVQSFLSSLLPQSLPDIATYSLYRFECALRSSAVLGFIGIETIGMSIHRSFENIYYREVWTELYLLLAVIISVDIIGAKVRHRLHTIPNRKQPLPELDSLSKNVAIHTLKKSAPRWKLPRIVAIALAGLIVISWLPNLFMINAKPLIGNRANSLTAERAEFFIHEITPEPARDSGSWEGVGTWADELW
ncbi:MAG: PhnE/PtxC family ABC transporter permease, partial [Akkermansiaceae bacterium]